jgi:autotransporter-associated beta strand protein
MQHTSVLRLAGALLLVGLSLVNTISAQTIYIWDGSNGANWSTGANWLDGTIPVDPGTAPDNQIGFEINSALNLTMIMDLGSGFDLSRIIVIDPAGDIVIQPPSNSARTLDLLPVVGEPTTIDMSMATRDLSFGTNGTGTLILNVGGTGASQTWNVAAGRTLSTVDVDGAAANVLTLTGGGTVVLGGTSDNASLTVATSGAGTLVTLAKIGSSAAIHALGGNTTTTIAAGTTMRITGTGGDQVFVQHDLQIDGTFDLNGNSEGFDALSSGSGITTGVITNGGATAAILRLNENGSGGNYGGIIQDGTGGISVIKVHTGTQVFAGNNTYTGSTTVSRGVLQLSGANGALSNTSGIVLDAFGELRLDSRTTSGGFTAAVNNNRIADTISVDMRGGVFSIYGINTADVSERINGLNVTKAHNTVRLSSDSVANANPAILTTTGLTMATLSRSAGASLNFVADNLTDATSFGTATTGVDGVYVRVVTGGISSSLISGGTVGTGVNRLLAGVFGSGSTTSANASDFLAVELNVGGYDYLRPLLASEYAALTGGQFVENAALVSANTTLGQSAAYNALKLSGGALTMGAGKVLFLGGHTADDISSTATQGAGMVLVTGGTGITGGTSILATLDFGTREAMFRAVGGTANIDARIAGSGGLVKSGTSALLLNNANTFTGNVYVNEGILLARNNRALGLGAGDVYVNGSGSTTQLLLGLGVNVTGKNVILGASGGNQVGFGVAAANASGGGHNTWGGNVVAANTGLGGRPDSDSNIVVASDTALTVYGNVYGAQGAAPADLTYYGNDPNATRRISFSGSGAGVINFAGVVSDLASGAAATTPADRLRINMTGNAELNVNIYNSLKVSGLLHLQQGYLRYVGDGNFFDSTTNATDRGVIMEATGTASQIALLLTKAGQTYSRQNVAGRVDIQVGNGGSDTTATTPSNVLVGGENESGVVTFGTGLQRLDFAPVASLPTAVSRFRDVRLYARQGGEVEFKMDFLDDTGFGLANEIGAITKVGLGTVRLTGRSGAANDVDGGVYALGGTLLLDYSVVSTVKVQAAEGAQFTTAGGDLRLIKTTSGANTTEKMSGALSIRVGGSEVSVDASTGATVNLNLATNTGATITRLSGGTINFVESGAGTKSIKVGLAANAGRMGSYATYGTANNTATSWAFMDGTNANDITAYAHALNEIDAFGAGFNTDLTANASLTGATTTNSIRFNNTAVSSLDLGAFTLNVASGGLLIGSGHTGPLTISNGALTTTGGTDLIIHNYGTGGLTITADITGAIPVTYAGTGVTTVSGAKTYVGTTYLVGGTVSIAANDALGATANTMYFNGGALRTTTSFTIDRAITIGGDAATFETAAGVTTTLTGTISREANFIYTETNASTGAIVNGTNVDNVGVGDILKKGAGTLVISNTLNNFSGVVDVREGVLQLNLPDVAAAQGHLGTNESWLDGTIVRGGATLTFSKTASSAIPTVAEWIRMENNSTLRITGGRLNTSGLMEIQGAVTVHVEGAGVQFDQQGGGGYMFGEGHITKTGNGMYVLLGNNSLYTGGFTILEGIMAVRGQGLVTGSDFTEVITIGGTTANNSEYRRMALSDFTNNQLVENHNFLITGSGPGIKRISFSNGSPPNGDDFLDFNGTITLNNALELNMESPANTRVHTVYFRMNGSFLGASGLSTRVVNGNANFARNGVFELNADNAAWSGALTVGNTSDSATNTHFLRLGNNNALQSDNAVILRHNARFQVGGRTVTAGNLTTSGVVGAASNEIVENAAHADGTIAFTQTADGNWDALFRDGTPIGTAYEDAAGSAAGKLNLVKEGAARATLTLDNQYTGSTTVNAGTLQVGSGGGAATRSVGDTGTGSTTSVLTVNAGGRVAGTGTIQGIASTTTHVVKGIISPGDVTTALADPTGIGTLDIVGNLDVSSGTIQLQAAGRTFNDATLTTFETGSTAYNNHVASNVATWDGLANGATRGNHDLLNINGQLTLDANSTVSLTFAGYNPVAGDVFDLLDWLGVLGGSGFNVGTNFRNGGDGGGDLVLQSLGANLVYDLSRFTSNGIITVAVGAVPEPGRALLFMMGTLSLLLRRRRGSRR